MMGKTIIGITMILILKASTAFSQTTFKEYKVGHNFYVALPYYTSKTVGIDDSAILQFKSTKGVSGVVIAENKHDLQLSKINVSSINQRYKDFIKFLFTEENGKKVSEAQFKKVGETNYIECDVSYLDSETDKYMYSYVGIAETPLAFYKVYCIGRLDSKDKFKPDFQKILYSIKD